MSGQIFISYRREDASHPAGRLYDHLLARFPKSRIFMDIDNLDPGEDFVEAIETSVGSCDALIAVIGRRWLDSSNEEGNRRLENPDDFVRLEIATALKRGIRVIPVLVDGAVMPRLTLLPTELQPLVRRQAIEVSHTRFGADSERLIEALNRAIEKSAIQEREREKSRHEAENREREEKQRQEAESSEVQQRENERLVNERREKDQLEAERLEAERQRRLAERERRLATLVQAREERERLESEGQSKGDIPPPSPAPSQDREPALAESPPRIAQSKGSTNQTPPAYMAPLVVLALILIVGLIWFAGSKLNNVGREAALVTPIRTPTPARTPAPTATTSPPSSVAEFYNNRGDEFFQRKDYDKAISDYSQAILLNPKYGTAYDNRGLAYYYTKNYDKAISDYSEAIRLSPVDSVLYYNRGLAYYYSKDYDKAISDFNEAIRWNPLEPDADEYCARGLAYHYSKDYDKAISDFNEAIRLSQNYALAYYNRGVTYRKQGKDAQAQADFDKAKQLGYTGPQ
jgi:tetratricopeptide (TPR) repeat protein